MSIARATQKTLLLKAELDCLQKINQTTDIIEGKRQTNNLSFDSMFALY